MVYPFHGQVPLFAKRHVFVNAAPGAIDVPSGIVTSATTTARSLHDASVAFGVSVMDVGDGVIGVANGVLVSGRVAVAKRDDVGISFDEIETLQAVNDMANNKINFFNISKHHHLSLDLFNGIAGDLFFERFTRQDRDFGEGAQ